MTRDYTSAAELADALISTIGRKIVLGLPIGIGKATHVADALFERACADSALSLTIFSGLTLETPRPGSELERRFLEPLIERWYAGWPMPAYAEALRSQQLPDNVDVREFYLRPGAYLGNPLVQQNHTSINYSQVAGELVDLGVNVIAQRVAARPDSPGHYSLSSNPEITLDLLPRFDERRARGEPVAIVGQVSRRLPYMLGDAELARERFDFVLDNDALDYEPFGLPNRRVSPADYATAMHVASLIPDGGTLQVGIGSLSDAVAHCLMLRHRAPEVFATVLDALPGGTRSSRRTALAVEQAPFEQGLFASTELMSDALFALFIAGLIRRPAGDGDQATCHVGFFIGSQDLYDGLRSLDEDTRRRINMTCISNVNSLYGDEARKRRQRRHARFVNETMMVTLLGAAVSDALDDGRVVSGVGGQFDFVTMAHALDDAMSILMCRARRLNRGVPESNIRWSYGHTTVPRHYRDVYVTEYGVAATRGRTDRQVIEAMLGVADSAFQDELLRQAVDARKVPASCAIPAEACDNTPAAIAAVFDEPSVKEQFPPYPLGSQLTPPEQRLAAALSWLKDRTAQSSSKLATIAGAALHGGGEDRDALDRMALTKPAKLRDKFLRRLVLYALQRSDT